MAKEEINILYIIQLCKIKKDSQINRVLNQCKYCKTKSNKAVNRLPTKHS